MFVAIEQYYVSVATVNIATENANVSGLSAIQIIRYDGNIGLLSEGSFF